MDTPAGRRAHDDLAAFYADGARSPDLAGTLAAMAGDDAVGRQRAERYLKALMVQSAADASNGRDQWQQTAYQGLGSESPARAFHARVAREFAAADDVTSDEAIEPALWLVRQGPSDDDAWAGMCVLRRVRSPRVVEVCRSLLTEPTPHNAVLLGLIEEAGKRKLTTLAPAVAALAGDYRASVREAVAAQAEALGLPPAAPFVPERAFTPWLEGELRAIPAMAMSPVPPGAKWCRFTVTTPDPAKANGPPTVDQFSGWLLGPPAATVRALTLDGTVQTWPAAQVRVADRTLAQDAQELVAIRDDAQLRRDPVRVPEALLAAWALDRGDRATAAAVIFPVYDQADDQRSVRTAARDSIGQTYTDQLLHAFVYDRDYPTAIALADHLAGPPFDGFDGQPQAEQLRVQLRARQAIDFKALTLPTLDGWATQRTTMTRAAQVAFLGDRLRLLNCFPYGMYHMVNYDTAQTPAPRRHGEEDEEEDDVGPSTRPGASPASVINPLAELRQMNLTAAELPALLPYLSDEDFMLAVVGRWRGTSRSLARVNRLAAEVFDVAAGQDVFDVEAFEAADADGRRQQLAAAADWVRAHASSPHGGNTSGVANNGPGK